MAITLFSREDDNNFIKSILNKIQHCRYNDDNVVVAYGGDGTLIDCFYEYSTNCKLNKNIDILPIRNYGLCDQHTDLTYLIDHFKNNSLKKSKHDILFGTYSKPIFNYNKALAEITIRNKNMTQAIRFNVYINDKLYAQNVIGDGIVICTTLGGTGYFKSVSNTIFKSGIGVGFINTTQHISNLIVSNNDVIKIQMIRGIANVAFDKYATYDNVLQEGEFITVQCDPVISQQCLIGYDIFMCQECRNNRHSAYVNDTFNVLN